jgi:hypothetical protein
MQWRRIGPVSDASLPGPPNAHAAYDVRGERLFLAVDSTLWSRGVDDPASWAKVELLGDRPLLSNAVAFDPKHKELIAPFAPLPGSDRVNAWSLPVGGKKATALDDVPTAEGFVGPPGLELLGSFPSPAVGSLRVAFQLPAAGPARLEVFDVLGRRRFERDVGSLGAGAHILPLMGSERWDAGVYFARLRRGEEIRTKRLVLVP